METVTKEIEHEKSNHKRYKEQGNQNFIISNAQKGGAVTIQGIKDQKCEIERQRNNKEHYKLLSTD